MSDPDRNDDGQTFDEWLEAYDAALVEECGLSSADLPDLLFLTDRWEACEEPEETAREVLTECGYFMQREAI